MNCHIEIFPIISAFRCKYKRKNVNFHGCVPPCAAMQSIRDGQNLLIFPEGTVIRDGIGKADGLPAHAHSGAAMIGVRTGAVFMPVFLDGKKRLFHKTRIIIGKPYTPVYTGRRGTAEEMQNIADDLLREIYALGGQQVGGAPL